MKNKRIASVMLGLLSTLTLAQCGGKDAKSKDVSLDMIPDDPVVINADLVYGPPDAEITITAPWFQMGWRLVNGSDSTLVLTTYKIESSGTKNGAIVSSESTLDPTLTCADEDGDDAPNSRNYLAIIGPGLTYRGLNPTDLTPVLELCDPTDVSSTVAERWYVDSLPEVDGFSYFVEVEAIGFFVNDDGDAIERLVSSSSMFTK